MEECAFETIQLQCEGGFDAKWSFTSMYAHLGASGLVIDYNH